MMLAGLQPVAAICEVVGDDAEVMRLPALLELGDRESAPVVTIEQLIHHLGSTTR